MWLLILTLFLIFYLLNNKTEKYHGYEGPYTNRVYPKSNVMPDDDYGAYYPEKYRWNYGAGYFSESNLGQVSTNYEPDFIPYGSA